ncbi:tryptophan synthase subunit alpha [Actinokineospora auranticolor]|uniref:Tryptophan synthase alpha chain n=1 Tax=Actinokineospora auranticolor TaxID=155976 RepID=A0A2S6GT35_9PSEU|nr:tryptophan synthase subunit alpha [Actinokineospora auranticolor]PPK68415.1 tryptophan synthase alpha chain [Actinokineospora auranticolor]
MADFFADRGGRVGLAFYLTAGDPPLDTLPEVAAALDESGVDCLELAVPFPDSVTDGPVVRASADRALRRGVDAAAVFAAVRRVRPGLRHTRIALLADWSHTVRPVGMAEFLAAAAGCGADGLLLHGLPPILRRGYAEDAARARVPVVATCYATSSEAVLAEAARGASAYLYLVARYGRSGTAPEAGFGHLSPVITRLRPRTTAPIAVGFGVRDRADVAAVGAAGADAAVVGSAAVSRAARAVEDGTDIAAALSDLAAALRPGNQSPKGARR